MAGGNSNLSAFLQTEKFPSSNELFEALWMPTSSSTLHGSSSMTNFETVNKGDTFDTQFLRLIEKEENVDEDFEGCVNRPAKKRRLTNSQVEYLEKSFEVDNKLEPERKVQLAKTLGLDPRQIAIWFQNRRARFKNKQLEKDYDSLKASFDMMKDDYDKLFKENENLKLEVLTLNKKLSIQEKGKKSVNRDLIPENPIENLKNIPIEPFLVCKQEDTTSSARSDVLDSDSLHGNHSPLMEPTGSSYGLELEQSDEEDDLMSKTFLHQQLCFPKLEDDYYNDPPTNSCNFGLDDQPFWSCLY